MLGLDRKLIEYRFPIKEGCKPHKQPPMRFNPHLMPHIKAEEEILLKARFIRIARYVEWLCNIVPAIKKMAN